MKNKIWHISDTHGLHEQLEVPEVDMVIFSGDAANVRNPIDNLKEYNKFLYWFKELPIKHKVLIAGNHDICIEKNLISFKEFKDSGIHYLHDDTVVVDDLIIHGSPYSPSFNNWAFNKARTKLHKVWDQVPPNIDILVTHTPPHTILDLSEDFKRNLECCGCKNLYKQVINRIKPQLHLFGHIHNNKKLKYNNSGTKTISNCNTLFSNGAVVADGKMDTIVNNGNILTI